jgi:L-cysteine S-thiosulfotransferase
VRRILGPAVAIAAAFWLSGALCGARAEQPRASAPAEPGNPLKFLIQGEEFLAPAIRAQQADDFDNPAFPLVETGEIAWSFVESGKSCEGCHGAGKDNALKRVAASYPKYVADAKGVITLQTRINLCRKNNLGLAPLADDTPRMMGLSAYLRWLARGSPSTVDVKGPNAEAFERGAQLYRTKLGLYQISCAQCHNEKFGKKFGAETMSQGHPLAYPAYKASEGRVISLHERFRMCNKLARGKGQPDNSPDYVALELYLDWRSKSLPITAPGVRP